MSPVLVIAGKDLRQRFRDRSAIVLGFVAPLAIAALMSFAFRGAEHFHLTVGIVDHDRGALSTAFADFLKSPDLKGVVTVRTLDSESTASNQVHSTALGAAVVVPAGFSAQAIAGSGATELVVLTSTDSVLAADVTRSLAGSFVNQVNADRISVVTAITAGAPAARAAQLGAAAAKLRVPENVVNLPIGSAPALGRQLLRPRHGDLLLAVRDRLHLPQLLLRGERRDDRPHLRRAGPAGRPALRQGTVGAGVRSREPHDRARVHIGVLRCELRQSRLGRGRITGDDRLRRRAHRVGDHRRAHRPPGRGLLVGHRRSGSRSSAETSCRSRRRPRSCVGCRSSRPTVGRCARSSTPRPARADSRSSCSPFSPYSPSRWSSARRPCCSPAGWWPDDVPGDRAACAPGASCAIASRSSS